MSDKEEHELGCGESFPMCLLTLRRSTATSARCSFPLAIRFSMELEPRIWFAAPQRRYLRAMTTRPCAPGKINAPPRSTSQNISPVPFRLFLNASQSLKSPDWKKKRRIVELSSLDGGEKKISQSNRMQTQCAWSALQADSAASGLKTCARDRRRFYGAILQRMESPGQHALCAIDSRDRFERCL